MAAAALFAQVSESVTDVVQGVIVVIQVVWLAAMVFLLVYAVRRFSSDRAPRFLVGAVSASVLIVLTVFVFIMAVLTGTFQ